MLKTVGQKGENISLILLRAAHAERDSSEFARIELIVGKKPRFARTRWRHDSPLSFVRPSDGLDILVFGEKVAVSLLTSPEHAARPDLLVCDCGWSVLITHRDAPRGRH